jgi:hypothetical protein
VDHPLPAPDAIVRPWRTAAYAAGAVAVVELLLLLVIGGGKLFGYVSDRLELAARESLLSMPAETATAATARKKAQAPAPVAVAKLPRPRTVVMVLNGNGRTGAAAAAASRVQSRGYRIGEVANAPRQIPRSIVMYRPGYEGEGRRLGKDLGVALVTPLDGMRAGTLRGAHVVFVLGP